MHTSSVVLGTDMLVVLEPGSKRFQALGTAPSQPGCADTRTTRLKKQLRVDAANWLCSGHRPERPAWLGSYDRVLLTRPEAPTCLPQRARPARLATDGGANAPQKRPAVMTPGPRNGGLRADKNGGFAQSCGRRWSLD